MFVFPTRMGAFGWVVFTGVNTDPITELGWSLGTLSTKYSDQSGFKVSGYEWLTKLLNNPSNLQDVLVLE